MCRKLIFPAIVVSLLGLVNVASGVTWTNATQDGLWRTAANWDSLQLPDQSSNVTIQLPVDGPLIDDGTEAWAYRLRGPGYVVPGEQTLTITGGVLHFGRYWRIGWGDGTGIVDMSGGTVNNYSNYRIYMVPSSTFYLSGGTVNSGFSIPEGYSTSSAPAKLEITGGMINASAAAFDETGRMGIGGPGVLNLHNGAIISRLFVIGANGVLNVNGGSITVGGSPSDRFILGGGIGPAAEFNMSGGTLTVTGERLALGVGGESILNMNGGLIEALGPDGIVNADNPYNCVINLNGGEIHATAYTTREPGSLVFNASPGNPHGGVLIADGDRTQTSGGGEVHSNIGQMILDGWISTTIPANIVTAVYDAQADQTIVRSVDALALINGLINDVLLLNLQQGIANSLDAKLDAALEAVDDLNTNNDVAAINALEAFINAVQAQSGNKIPEADADALIAAAQEIIAILSGA